MGGGKVTRPDFGFPDARADNPLTEFYLLIQKTLSRTGGTFALPGAYASFCPPPDHQLYAEEIRDFCTFYSAPHPGCLEIFSPGRMQVLYDDLRVTADGTPAALMLSDESSRLTTALQLLPPFFSPDFPPAPLPECTCALTLTLCSEDLILMDNCPAELGRRLCRQTDRKSWQSHPRIERWLTTALAAAQRSYRHNE
jgi:hypothetical protein